MPRRRFLGRYLDTVANIRFDGTLSVLLVLCWILGGVTSDSTSADEILQLASLPVLAWALWRFSDATPSRSNAVALGLVLAIVAIPLWQLISPIGNGMAGEARTAIGADLLAAELPNAKTQGTLSAFATERALWSLLPALALFLGALTVRRIAIRRLLQLVLILVLASAAFAFFQLSLPEGSSLLLYKSWGRSFGGVFVNPNHQGSALAIGAVIATALFVEGRDRAREDGGIRHWMYALICALCAVMVPLANGSAAMLLLMLGVVAVVLILGVRDWRSFRHHPTQMLPLAGAILATVVVVTSAATWQRADQDRQLMASNTIKIGTEFAPLGAGVGTFVSTYAQFQNPDHARREVINHAHNEYAQWWLEGGVPALLVIIFGYGIFAWAGWQVLARMRSGSLRALAAAAWVGLMLLLLHSVVDFPLRTTTLMATAGLLAGLLLNALNVSTLEKTRAQVRDAATQPA